LLKEGGVRGQGATGTCRSSPPPPFRGLGKQPLLKKKQVKSCIFPAFSKKKRKKRKAADRNRRQNDAWGTHAIRVHTYPPLQLHYTTLHYTTLHYFATRAVLVPLVPPSAPSLNAPASLSPLACPSSPMSPPFAWENDLDIPNYKT